LGREGERTERAVDVDEVSAIEREMRTGRALDVDADEQLEPAVALCILGRRGDRVRPPLLLTVIRDRDRLPWRVVERVTVQIEPDHTGARRGGDDLADGQREHGGLCYLTDGPAKAGHYLNGLTSTSRYGAPARPSTRTGDDDRPDPRGAVGLRG